MTAGLVVGFDLDMTLIDPRPGVRVALRELGIDEGYAEFLGPPLEEWLPAGTDLDLYRTTYLRSAHLVSALPGAADALDAVRAAGGRVAVVTAKRHDLATACLAGAGLEADELHASLWGESKADALRSVGASVYVGDHPLDMVAARLAGAYGIGVASGPLQPVGGDVLLPDLSDFSTALSVARLDRQLRGLGSVLVAFSGGADSALVLAAAVRSLGAANVVAATAVSASLPVAELSEAQAFAASLGVRHVSPETDEMSREGYRANAGNRCYFCKSELIDVLLPVAGSLGLAAVVTGTNADDAVAGFRPGIRAADERGAVAPLRDAGFTKAAVRAVSHAWGLRTWDKPAAACLSSRIAYGIEVTPEGLARVERAESVLRFALTQAGHPVTNLRVRDLGDGVASVEVDRDLVGVVQRLVTAVEGFTEVRVDPRGFRSGSMNELLPLA